VAFTRARTKLLVVGSAKTIRGNELLGKFVTLMEGRGWMYDLPKGALEGHLWDQFNALELGIKSDQIEEVKKIERHDEKELSRPQNNRKKNIPGKCRQVPLKVVRLDPQMLLGKRPVLRDIVNDAS
jgi:DNA replication ATP-dependent helicase Dna2